MTFTLPAMPAIPGIDSLVKLEVPPMAVDINNLMKSGTPLFENPLANLTSDLSAQVPPALAGTMIADKELADSVAEQVALGNLSPVQARLLLEYPPGALDLSGALEISKSAETLSLHTMGQAAQLPETMGLVATANAMASGFGEFVGSCDKMTACIGSLAGAGDIQASLLSMALGETMGPVSAALSAVPSGADSIVVQKTNELTAWVKGLTSVADPLELSEKYDAKKGAQDLFNSVLKDATEATGAVWEDMTSGFGDLKMKAGELGGDINDLISTELAQLSSLANDLKEKAMALAMPGFLNDPCMKMVISRTAAPVAKLAMGLV